MPRVPPGVIPRQGRLVTLLHRRDLPLLSPGRHSFSRRDLPSRGQGFRHRQEPPRQAWPNRVRFRYGLVVRLRLLSTFPHGKCSYHCSCHFRLQAGNVRLRGTFTPHVKRLHRCTKSPCAILQHLWNPLLRESWQRNPLDYARRSGPELCPQYSRVKGKCRVADAVEMILLPRPK